MKRILFIFIILFATASYVHSQDKNADEFIPDLASDSEMATAKPSREPFILSYGGWLMPMFLDDRRESDSKKILTSSVTTLKLWGKMSLGGNSFIYIRGKDTYTAVIGSKNYNIDKRDNNVDLDAGYIEAANSDRSLKAATGRKFFNIGSGLILNGRGDGASFFAASKYVDVDLFGFYTGLINADNNPYGLSSKDYSDGSKRIFAGINFSKDISNQTLYIFGVAQIDRGNEDSGVKSRYDSQYYGIGIKGVPSDGIDYSIEAVYESGKSYTFSQEKESVSAYALTAVMDYYFDMTVKPSITLQYAFGSGDNDRTGSATMSGGNTASRDTGFVSFGTFNGGYALRPSLSNIHILRAGAGFIPFATSSSDRLTRMSLNFRYNYYLKDKVKGCINNGDATEENRQVGQGIDLSLRWKIYCDLSFFAQYGLFIPGSAFVSTEKNRSTAISGMMIEF